MLQAIFYFSFNFCFSFVSNSLAHITIPKNKGKIKINCNIYKLKKEKVEKSTLLWLLLKRSNRLRQYQNNSNFTNQEVKDIVITAE